MGIGYVQIQMRRYAKVIGCVGKREDKKINGKLENPTWRAL